MATLTESDYAALLAPIAGDDPAGRPLPADVLEKLNDYREEFEPDELPESDARRGDPRYPRKVPNWAGISTLARDTLANTSKDLRVAARLAEALTRTDGFAGARDGLRLLRRLADECWERVRPPLTDPDEPDAPPDLELRAGVFTWLDDPRGGALYPHTLRALPLIFHGTTPLSALACLGYEKRPATVPLETLQVAARAADPAHCRAVAESVDDALAEVDRLGALLNARMPAEAPSFHDLRTALEACQQVAAEIGRARGGDETAAAADAPAGATAAAGGPVQSRDAAYRQLAEVAAALERLEPHSPVPYLIRRAVELRALRFPELVEELTRDGTVLAFLKREVGGPAESSSD
jgi:type VI secretion system protein ImpA